MVQPAENLKQSKKETNKQKQNKTKTNRKIKTKQNTKPRKQSKTKTKKNKKYKQNNKIIERKKVLKIKITFVTVDLLRMFGLSHMSGWPTDYKYS